MSTEPQSILHHIIRLERKISRSASFTNLRGSLKSLASFRKSKDKQKTEKDHDKTTRKRAEKAVSQDDASVSTAITSPANSLSSGLDFSEFYSYRTINQTELVKECLMDKRGSYFIHFVVDGSSASKHLDKQMERINNRSCFQCVRLESSKLAPSVAAKLEIEKDTPTVLAIKNGSIEDRISEFVHSDYLELRAWAATLDPGI